MSGHASFDHTVDQGNLWLKTVARILHLEDTRHAYSALRATLHALRDRLTPESAVHLSAQLTMIVRGLYFEGWKLAGKPSAEDSVDAFCSRIAAQLPPTFPRDPKTAAQGVLAALWEELDQGEIAKIIDQMPTALRGLWPEIARRG